MFFQVHKIPWCFVFHFDTTQMIYILQHKRNGFLNVGLFEIVVGVLTTCLTQYT